MYEFAVAPAVTSIRRRGVEISDVAPYTIGAELDLEPGDRVLKVNGRVIKDYLDFRFHTAGETELTLEVRKASGEHWELQIERAESEDIGVAFEQIIPRQCANECIFCFCKGNPDDARPSLFIRDEDIRLSFLYGNYTTLTSLTPDELRRIVEQRLSPQYVSVHAMDLDVRSYLLGVSRERADISDKLARLLDAGIEIHAQVVLCPRINDGEVLLNTLADLASRYPGVRSVAIVPLGLTRYNTDDRLTPVTAEFCKQIIKEVRHLQAEFRRRLGTTFAYLGDEIYLKAGASIPGRRHYGNYPQIEDGIGMVRSFLTASERVLRRLERHCLKVPMKANGTLLTGTLFGPVLGKVVEELNSRLGTSLRVAMAENQYFGGDVSVAGLLTGRDIIAARAQITGDFLIVTNAVLKSGEEIMLDGTTLSSLRDQLAIPVWPVGIDGLEKLLRQQCN
ncbi:MAG TPA: DUF512 domain-containing protein [Pyrinomonadaceae bacterium]|nr:DUF512 domain-containing protein [Pyrinomonadaceae bacterium]